MGRLKMKKALNNEVDRFIDWWHEFPIDYWWRKKYNVPFGSKQHREMNFFDMLIEWREDLAMVKLNTKVEDDELDTNSLRMTQKEIDDEYENLDLGEF